MVVPVQARRMNAGGGASGAEGGPSGGGGGAGGGPRQTVPVLTPRGSRGLVIGIATALFGTWLVMGKWLPFQSDVAKRGENARRKLHAPEVPRAVGAVTAEDATAQGAQPKDSIMAAYAANPGARAALPRADDPKQSIDHR